MLASFSTYFRENIWNESVIFVIREIILTLLCLFSHIRHMLIFFTDRTVCFFLPLSYFETVILEFISACVRTESKMAGIERHMNRIQLQNEELSSLLIITFRSSWPCGESVQRGSGRRTYSDKLICLAFFLERKKKKTPIALKYNAWNISLLS